MPINSEFSGSKLKVYLTFSDFGWLSRDNPSPLTQIFGNAFAERDWEAVRGRVDPSLTLHWPLTHHTKPTRNAKGANGQATSCSSLFRREQTLIPQGADCQSVGSDWQFALMRLPAKSIAQTIWADEPIAISEGLGKGEWGGKSTPHPLSRPFYKAIPSVFSEGWGVSSHKSMCVQGRYVS